MAGMTTLPLDPFFDLQNGVGQRAASFRFELIDGVTGQILAEITPLFGAALSHNTIQTIKRRLTIALGAVDTEVIDVVNNRVNVFMLANGQEYELGRYLFTGNSRQFFSSGRLSNATLVDEMFIVDQPIDTGINGVGKLVSQVIQEVLSGLKIDLEDLPPATFFCSQSWGVGASRGSVLDALATSGDYFSPWLGNDSKLHFVRSFNPADVIPQFDYDAGNQVFQQGIVETDELLSTPNRIIVISNSAEAAGGPIVGVADISPSAPNSIQNRGFVVAKTFNLQLSTSAQAQAVAAGIAQRMTVFEMVSLSTPPDPRHDSYDVIRWQDENWLELGWSMNLMEGGAMTHTLRKAYS